MRHEQRDRSRCRGRLAQEFLPLIKGTYGFALTQKCPYTYFSDLIIGETTCDGKKKMYELLNDIKPTYVLHLPQSQSRSYASDIWREEVELLKQELERRFDVEITDEALRDAVRLRNRARRAFNRLYALQENVPPAMSGVEMMTTLLKSTFSFDVEKFVEWSRRLPMRAVPPTRRGERPVRFRQAHHAHRLPVGRRDPEGRHDGRAQRRRYRVSRRLLGERTQSMLIDEDADDILRAISDRYLRSTARS